MYKRTTGDLVLASAELDRATGTIYNYCPYGFHGLCMQDEESQCLLNKCYHDMNSLELSEFKNFWLKSRKWFNKCNHNGGNQNGGNGSNGNDGHA